MKNYELIILTILLHVALKKTHFSCYSSQFIKKFRDLLQATFLEERFHV